MTTKLAPKTISQHKLRRYVELERDHKEYEALKKEIMALAMAKLPCQNGRFSCRVRVSYTTSVPWKQEFIRVTDELTAERILADNKSNTPRRSLDVIDRENPLG